MDCEAKENCYADCRAAAKQSQMRCHNYQRPTKRTKEKENDEREKRTKYLLFGVRPGRRHAKPSNEERSNNVYPYTHTRWQQPSAMVRSADVEGMTCRNYSLEKPNECVRRLFCFISKYSFGFFGGNRIRVCFLLSSKGRNSFEWALKWFGTFKVPHVFLSLAPSPSLFHFYLKFVFLERTKKREVVVGTKGPFLSSFSSTFSLLSMVNRVGWHAAHRAHRNNNDLSTVVDGQTRNYV